MQDVLKNEKFERYFTLLSEENAHTNLTAIEGREAVFHKHFKDSLLGEPFISKNARVLDIGSGAGFPGVPIAIVRQDLNLTLIDSVKKKVDFLNKLICELDLSNVRALHVRAEDFKERAAFDHVVFRAVAKLSTLLEYGMPFLKVGGTLIAYKSGAIDEELKQSCAALTQLNGQAETERRRLDDETERCFVIVKKTGETPEKYPRGKNLPRKKPL